MINTFFVLYTASFLFMNKKLILQSLLQKYNPIIIEAYGFLYFTMTIIIYFWLKSKIYLEEVPVIENNTFRQAIKFIGTYAFCGFNSTIHQCFIFSSANLYKL